MRLFKSSISAWIPTSALTSRQNTYWDWVIRHAYFGTPIQQHVAAFLATFKEYPPSQRPASFNLETQGK